MLLRKVLGLFSLACVFISPAEAAQRSAKSIFGLKKVVTIHLQVGAAEWRKLQPPPGTRTDDLSSLLAMEDALNDLVAGRPFWKESASRPGLAGYLGIDHQYGRANVTIDDEQISGIGLRYKGNGSFTEGLKSGRIPFKLDFAEYSEQEFRGLKKLNLHNNARDPSMLREALTYELFREAGIPSPRVCFAKVLVTVPGEFEAKSFGVYTVVEQVDKRFLKNHYRSAEGLLLKPSTYPVFPYLGERWDNYVRAYAPETAGTPEQHQRVMEFARLLHDGDDATFQEHLERYLDTDAFLRFVAVNALLSNLDSFIGGVQNYYVYLAPESDKFYFLPWDPETSFGGYPTGITAESLRNLSIARPGGDRNRLIERVLQIPRYKERYQAYLASYLDTVFAEAKMHRQIADTAALLRPVIHENDITTAAFDRRIGNERTWREFQPLQYFVTRRHESVRDQLAGRADGVVPFTGKMRPLPIRKAMSFAAILLLLLLSNAIVWVYGIVAGFRSGRRWAALNAFFYPVAPLIFGFRVRPDLGRHCARWAAVGGLSLAVWIVIALVTFL